MLEAEVPLPTTIENEKWNCVCNTVSVGSSDSDCLRLGHLALQQVRQV